MTHPIDDIMREAQRFRLNCASAYAFSGLELRAILQKAFDAGQKSVAQQSRQEERG